MLAGPAKAMIAQLGGLPKTLRGVIQGANLYRGFQQSVNGVAPNATLSGAAKLYRAWRADVLEAAHSEWAARIDGKLGDWNGVLTTENDLALLFPGQASREAAYQRYSAPVASARTRLERADEAAKQALTIKIMRLDRDIITGTVEIESLGGPADGTYESIGVHSSGRSLMGVGSRSVRLHYDYAGAPPDPDRKFDRLDVDVVLRCGSKTFIIIRAIHRVRNGLFWKVLKEDRFLELLEPEWLEYNYTMVQVHESKCPG